MLLCPSLCVIFVVYDRVCASPHATLRGGVPAVRLPLDEQPPDEGAAATVHHQTVGHLSGAVTHKHTARLLRAFVTLFALFLSMRL